MPRAIAGLVFSLCVIACVAFAFLVFEMRANRARAMDGEAERAALEVELADMRREREQLLASLADAEASIARGESRIEALRLANETAKTAANAEPDDGSEESAASPTPRDERHTPYVLERLEDADRLAAAYFQAGDIESLWLLAADLLAYGAPGFDKVIELGRFLDSDEFEEIMRVWSEEELLVGPFLQAVSANGEGLARFGLHVSKKDPAELPKWLRQVSKDIPGEMGALMLGIYPGDDPEIFDGYTDVLERSIQADPGGRGARRAALALAHVPLKRSRDLLRGMLATSGDVAISAARALAWQGSVEALPEIQALLESPELDERARKIVVGAIRHLQSRR